MKSLIIFAHPASKSLSRLFATRYAKVFSGEAEVIDLYDPQWKQDFLRFEDIKDLPPDPARDRIQQKIAAADELVFFFPIWWGHVPAILKNFFDQNLSSDFAFKYHEGGKHDKLLTGKTAKIFATSNGPKWIYFLIGMPFFVILKYITLEFCGIKVKKMKLFDKARYRSAAEIEAWARQVEISARS